MMSLTSQADSASWDSSPDGDLARMPRPTFAGSGPELWVDEAIWGHRLYDDQTPWLTLLECLGVALAEHGEGRAFEEPCGPLTYTPLVQLRLRNILFNSPQISVIASNGESDEARWSRWLEDVQGNVGGLVDPDFSYLRSHFATFQDFAAVVGFLRSSTIEGPNNKRWSSQFLFPFGPSALYEDLNVRTSGSYQFDRRFFARTGEILYLMLARSGHGAEIARRLDERMFKNGLPYSKLVTVLQGEDQRSQSVKTGAYLPYRQLPDYPNLAADWLAILGRSLPGYDALPHLATISALHLMLYLLRRARIELGEAPQPRLIVEIVSPRKTVVRDLSADSYALNNMLPQRAVTAYINRFTTSPAWAAAIASEDAMAKTREAMHARFLWPSIDSSDEETLACRSPQSLIELLQKRALVRHRAHVAKIHGVWGRGIGLSSRRASRRTRYAPTDALLKTLVICCVDGRMEFHEFLALLFERYGLVIGSREAQACDLGQQADPEAFDDNADRLEERLSSLGLVRRLSDQCAYVVNPFANGGVA